MKKVPILLMLALALAGCGKKAKDLRVSMFSEMSIQPMMRELVAEFEKETGVSVELNYIPYANYNEKLLVQTGAGTAPDVINIEAGVVGGLQAGGALVSLDKYIKADKVDLGQFYSQLVDHFTFNGQLYVYPTDIAPMACLYYNKDMFKAAGLAFPTAAWTWDDLLKAALKLRKAGADGRTTVFGFRENYGPDWASMILSNGGKVVDDPHDPRRCLMDSPQAIEAVQFIVDLEQKHNVSPLAGEPTQLNSLGQTLFMDGKVGMIHTGIWIVPALAGVKDFAWDIAPFPRGPRASRPGWTSGGSGYAISRSSKRPDDAWKLIKYLSTAKAQGFMAARGVSQPAIRSLARSETFVNASPRVNRAFLDKAADLVTFWPRSADWAEINVAVIGPRMDVLLRKGGDVAPALRELTAAVNVKLAQK